MRDFYATPWEATAALLMEEQFEGSVHEPACGDGAMTAILNHFGYQVLSSDIEPLEDAGMKLDFFDIKVAYGDNIITNPPFNLAVKFIEHALDTLKPKKFALLLKSTFFHADKRYELFLRHKPKIIYPLTWRLDFLNKGCPTMECAWFVWHRGNQDLPAYKLLRRPAALPVATRI